MNIREIEPAFEKINERLLALEECAHKHVDDETDPVTTALQEIVPEHESEPEPEQEPEPEPEHEEENTQEQEAEPEPEPEPEPEQEEENTQEQKAEILTQPDTESEVELEGKFPDSEIPLNELVAMDVRPFGAADVANAIMNHPKLKHARELVMKPETGVMEKVQSFRFTDGTFMVPSRETFQRLVAETKIDEVEWVKDVSDCEDICLRFNAKSIELGINSCGRIMSWSGGHCFIIAIVRDDESLGFAFLEPQTDTLLTDEIGEGMYSLENCLIIIN